MKERGVFSRYPVAKDLSQIMVMASLFPVPSELIDRGNVHIACTEGLHHTDTATYSTGCSMTTTRASSG